MDGAIPEHVRRAAVFPHTNFPEPPAGHPSRIHSFDGFAVRVSAGLPMALVLVDRVDEPEHALDTVRRIAREERLDHSVWIVAEEAKPHDLAARLAAQGLTPAERPPFEPRGTAMAIVEPPLAGDSEIVARQVETLEELLAANEVAAGAFGKDDEMRAAYLARARRAWPFEQPGGSIGTFLATVGREPAGFGTAIFGPHAAFLSGGATSPEFRGSGVYRTLVRARWDAAVARGTPALTVGAGRMSRPALERLGFHVVGWYDVLLDDLA